MFCKWHYFVLFYGWIILPCIYMYHIFFIHSSVSGHLVASRSWLLKIVLQWTLGCMYLFEVWFSPDICPVVGLLDHLVVLFLVFPLFLRNLCTVLPGGCTNLHCHQQCRRLLFTHSLAFIVCRLFDDGHSDWCEVMPHCSFHLHFSKN